jgi:hypothetical protein
VRQAGGATVSARLASTVDRVVIVLADVGVVVTVSVEEVVVVVDTVNCMRKTSNPFGMNEVDREVDSEPIVDVEDRVIVEVSVSETMVCSVTNTTGVTVVVVSDVTTSVSVEV